jgi:hypothetical protein
MITKEIKYRTGTMTKSPSQMSEDELKRWQEEGKKEIREYLFSINQPLVNYKNGVFIVEYKDGRIEEMQ